MHKTESLVSARSCEGGHRCSPPKECCPQGCCYLYAPPSAPKAQVPNNTSHVLNLFFINHWFFWCTIFAIVIAILCACSLWKKRRQICGWGSPRPHSQSGDSTGSCYAPPQYSRCTSFHHAPPPYAEVTNKPDLYPLVFSCNNSDNGKNGASYLMVQYFRNYIVRPVGSLSATSTVDSLSSSFICNANEANTLIPPPYSRAGSPNLPMNIQDYSSMPRSASQMCTLEQGQNQRSIPVVMTNSNLDGEQITLYRHYHDFTHETADVGGIGGGDDTSYVQFRRTSNSVSFQELQSNSTNENQPSPPYNGTNNNIRANPNYNTMTNNADTLDDLNSDLSKPCNVIADAQSLSTQKTFDMMNNATIVHEQLNHKNNISSNQNNSNSTKAKCKPLQTSLSYSNSSNGFFDSYDSIDDDANDCGLNMPIAGRSLIVSTPTGATHRDFNDLNGPLRKHRHDKFDVINENKPLNVSASLPFSEESPVNGEILKKYGMAMRGYTDSMSGSAVSSLANFDSPTSPPQATSPTGEIRELLEQIRQLQQNANSPDGFASSQHEVQSGAATTISNESSSLGGGADAYDGDESSTSNSMLNKIQQQQPNQRPSTLQQNRRSYPRTRFFAMSAAKNLRSPIGSSNILSFNRNRKGWISKSAPTTPGTTMPASYINDDSPLLNEHDEDAEPNA
ncbi:putative mediator of RNA polymerase II transcription subunit 26 isoform X2 [Sitodiplosis mosellana]|uniref:putative mediator of RNA polymerase II transcription subunit 26 isoform X2 n=1 Tax=Sitodiplosis mosellana TaxID=263140 RepID=UPI0024440681|nr:putative mediator of RNA polymerase II transcription subunit 26 isoform X2 [Sitodiplosis mosellana]